MGLKRPRTLAEGRLQEALLPCGASGGVEEGLLEWRRASDGCLAFLGFDTSSNMSSGDAEKGGDSSLSLSSARELKPKRELEVSNIYMNIAMPLRRSMLFFIAQIGLFSYYVFNLNSDPDTHDWTNVSIAKWMVGVIITAIAGEDETGRNF